MTNLLLVHTEGNINNNPNLFAIVELLCGDGYRVDLFVKRNPIIDQNSYIKNLQIFFLDDTNIDDVKRFDKKKYSLIIGIDTGIVIAATCSVIAIQVLSLRFKSYSPRSFLRSLLKPAILIFTLLFSIWYYASISKIDYFRQHGLSLFTDPLDAVSFRMDRWESAFAVVLDNPLGVGIWGFPGADGQSWVAHNLYLFLLLSFGIVGFIGFFWFFLRYTKACWSGLHPNSSNRRLLCIAGMGCVTTLFVAGFGSCIFWSPWSILMGWLPIGIIMTVATLPERDGGQ